MQCVLEKIFAHVLSTISQKNISNFQQFTHQGK